MDKFEQAAREKIRFSCRGQITAEDLFDLSEKDLNDIYVGLAKGKKDSDIGSLINSREDKTLTLKMDIVKHVFDVKREEATEAKKKIDKKKRNERILEIIEKKQNADLEGKSAEELQALLDA